MQLKISFSDLEEGQYELLFENYCGSTIIVEHEGKEVSVYLESLNLGYLFKINWNTYYDDNYSSDDFDDQGGGEEDVIQQVNKDGVRHLIGELEEIFNPE